MRERALVRKGVKAYRIAYQSAKNLKTICQAKLKTIDRKRKDIEAAIPVTPLKNSRFDGVVDFFASLPLSFHCLL